MKGAKMVATSGVGHIVEAPGALPLLGHAVGFFRDPQGFVASLPVREKLVRVRLGPQSMVMVCDPELTYQVMVDDKTYDKGGPVSERAREILGKGLVTCAHSQHRRMRRLCQPAFHAERLPAYSAPLAAAAVALVDSWHPGQVIDVREEMNE